MRVHYYHGEKGMMPEFKKESSRHLKRIIVDLPCTFMVK